MTTDGLLVVLGRCGVLTLLVACVQQGPATGPRLGGDGPVIGGGRPIEPTSPEPPEPPALPELPRFVDWSCPPGWSSEVVGRDTEWQHSVCAPPATRDCPPGQVQFASDAGCQRLGTECPTGGERFLHEAEIRRLADDDDSPVRYVDPRARLGGDGGREHPFKTIADAKRRPGRPILALAATRFRESVSIALPVSIVGACVTETIIEGPGTQADVGTIRAEGHVDVLIANLAVTGNRPGIEGVQSGRITLRDVEVSGSRPHGVSIAHAPSSMRLERVWIHDIVGTGNDLSARGIQAQQGGHVEGSEIRIERAAGISVYAIGDSSAVDLSDVRITGPTLLGVLVSNGAEGRLSHAVAEHTRQCGICSLPTEQAHDAGANFSGLGGLLDLEDVAITDALSAIGADGIEDLRVTRAYLSDLDGVGIFLWSRVDGVHSSAVLRDIFVRRANKGGIEVAEDATVDIQHLVIDDVAVGGILTPITEERPTISAADVVVRNVRRPINDEGGSGIQVRAGARVTLVRALLADGDGLGLVAVSRQPESPSVLDLEDVTVRRFSAGGLGAVLSGHITARRVVLSDNGVAGIIAGEYDRTRAAHDVRMDLSDITVTDSRSFGRQRQEGMGLLLTQGARVDLVRAHFARNTGAAILAQASVPDGATTLSLSDAIIEATRSRADGTWGVGIAATHGAQVDVDRVLVEHNRFAGVIVEGGALSGVANTTLRISNATLRSTEAATCSVHDQCVDDAGRSEGGGIGLLVGDGSSVDLEDFVIERSASSGLVVAGGLDARRGVITANAVGIQLIPEDYDLSRLGNDIYAYGNEVDVAQGALALPSPEDIFDVHDEAPEESE